MGPRYTANPAGIPVSGIETIVLIDALSEVAIG